MKISFVEIAGFRGFRDRVRFDLPAGFVVLTGRNGAGKSTVLDAIDFVFTGTINKFAVTAAKGGGLDSHIWWVGAGKADEHFVSVGFHDDDGDEFVLTRSRERGLDVSADELCTLFCATQKPNEIWPHTLIQTSLIRDETLASLSLDLAQQARFEAVQAAIGGLDGEGHTNRTREIFNEANRVQHAQEDRVVTAQEALGRALTAVTEARSSADRQRDVSEAQQLVARLLPDVAVLQRSEELRRFVAERKQAFAALMAAILELEEIRAEKDKLFSSFAVEEMEDAQARLQAARATVDLEEALLGTAFDEFHFLQEANSSASKMVELLNHGEELGLHDGHCPLCDAVRTDAEFAASIEKQRSHLSDVGRRFEAAGANYHARRSAYAEAQAELGSAVEVIALLEQKESHLNGREENISALFHRFDIDPSTYQSDELRILILQKLDEAVQLEHAMFVLESSRAHDQLTNLETQADRLRDVLEDEEARLGFAQRAVELAKQIDSAAKSVSNQALKDQFDTVMPLLKELYQRLRPHTDWREIETDFGGKVRSSLNLTVGDGRNPQFLFSSGQRRAAGLAFLLAIHLSRPWCKLRTLLLDDPVQHIDDYRALNLVEVLSAVRRAGRQVIVAVEDPALADLLCRRLRSTPSEYGRRFDLGVNRVGTSEIVTQTDIVPMPRQVLQAVS